MTQVNYLERKAVDPITAKALEGLLDNRSAQNRGADLDRRSETGR